MVTLPRTVDNLHHGHEALSGVSGPTYKPGGAACIYSSRAGETDKQMSAALAETGRDAGWESQGTEE